MSVAAVLLAGLAAWIWAGPGAAAVRLTGLLAAPRDRPYRPPWRALLRRRGPEATAAAWRAASIELCQGVVAELSAGRTPGDAIARAIAAASPPDPEVLAPVAAAARDGGDVAAALLRAAPVHGGEGLVRLAACWQVGMTVGGGLTVLVERVAASLRAAEAHRLELAAQLAGPRATARMLAGLPVLGLVLGAGLGMNPLSFLLGGPAGIGCLIIGLALDAAGVRWTGRLARRALEPLGAGEPPARRAAGEVTGPGSGMSGTPGAKAEPVVRAVRSQ